MSLDRILVPVDFSACSQAALEYGLELARQTGASIEVLHAWTVPSYVSPALALEIAGHSTTLTVEQVGQADAEERMAKFLERLSDPKPKRFVKRVVFADTVDAIQERALDADLVITGTHGRNALGRFFLGSIAEKLVRQCPRPLISIRAGADGRGPALPKRILVPVDFSSGAERALEHATEFAAVCGAKVDVLHVIEHVPALEGTERLVRVLAGDKKEPFHRWAQETGEAETKLFLSTAKGHESAGYLARVGHPAETILEVAENYDLIVMSARGTTITTPMAVGGVAQRVLREAKCPVLTIRRYES